MKEQDFPPSLEALAESVTRGRGLVASLDLKFDGCAIRVRSNSRELIDILTSYFDGFVMRTDAPDMEITAINAEPPVLDIPLFRKAPDPGKTKVKEEFRDIPGGRVVRKRLTGMIFIFGGDVNIAVGPSVEQFNQIVNFINSRFIQWNLRRGGLLMHSAGVAHCGRGMALSGFSGMGKSTLALGMVSLGALFVSNDRLVAKKTGNGVFMTGVAKLPRINPGTALNNPDLARILTEADTQRFSAMGTNDLWEIESKYDVFIREIFGKGIFSIAAPMNALAILNWRRDGGPVEVASVDLEKRRDLLAAFMKSTGLFFENDPLMPEPDFSGPAYLDMLSGIPALEISGGVDFKGAAQALMDYLANDRPLNSEAR